jgi:hypothetical protein
MKLKRFVAILVVLTLLSTGIVRPKPAHAVNTAWLVLGSIAAYVAAVCLGAYLVYGRNSEPQLLVDVTNPDFGRDRAADGLRPGYRCRQADGDLTLVCW